MYVYVCRCKSDSGNNEEDENIWMIMAMNLMMVVVVIMMVMMMELVETVCWHSPYPRWVWPLHVHPVEHFQTKKSNSETTTTGNQGKDISDFFNAKCKTKSMYGSDVLALLRQAWWWRCLCCSPLSWGGPSPWPSAKQRWVLSRKVCSKSLTEQDDLGSGFSF